MGMKNMRDVLVAGTKLPAKIEELLPEKAPKISTMLLDTANKVPEGPGFPVELPDFPELPATPEGGILPKLGTRYIKEVEVTPVGAKGIEARMLGDEILS